MRKKNGFTLVELLVTISMLAVVGTIIIYNVVSLNNDTKDLQYDRMVENIKNAAKTYVSLYPEDFSDLYSSKAFQYMKIQQLIDEGLLDEDTTNPYTNETVGGDERIRAYVDGSSYEMVFDYPVTSNSNLMYITAYDFTSGTVGDTDNLAALNVYYGLSTNTFSMVNEDGTLDIDYVAAGYTSLIAYYESVYNLTYTVPNSFTQCTTTTCTEEILGEEVATESLKYYYIPESAGTYEITYKWVDPTTKVNRSYKRKVRVTDSRTSSLEKSEQKEETTEVTLDTSDTYEIAYQMSSKEFYGSTDTCIDTGVNLGTGNWKIDAIFIPKEGTTDHRTIFSSYDDKAGVELKMSYAKSTQMTLIPSNSTSWVYINSIITTQGTDRIEVIYEHLKESPNRMYYVVNNLTTGKSTSGSVSTYINTNQSRTVTIGAAPTSTGTCKNPFTGTIESVIIYKDSE